MSLLENQLEALLPAWRTEMQRLVTQYGEEVIDSVCVSQVLGGMRGIRGLTCDTSSVDPERGLSLRGIPVLELIHLDGDDMFWLLLTGRLPGTAEREWLLHESDRRRLESETAAKLLAVLPRNMDPVQQYAILLMAYQSRSSFAQHYGRVPKGELWRFALEDAINLRIWASATFDLLEAHRSLTAGKRPLRAEMTGEQRDRYDELLRLYAVVHSDHENSNASAFASHAVGSALADPVLALVASVNALAGPIHGKAAQTCLGFVQQLMSELGEEVTEERVAAACWARLQAKQIIPGFGHAVLRGEDPRFVALKAFGDRCCSTDPVYQVASLLYRVAPEVLKQHGAASSPYPNVDAIGGVLLWCCGLRYPEFYTIMFSLAQMNGLLADFVLSRGLGLPIMRPRSISLEQLRASAAN